MRIAAPPFVRLSRREVKAQGSSAQVVLVAGLECPEEEIRVIPEKGWIADNGRVPSNVVYDGSPNKNDVVQVQCLDVSLNGARKVCTKAINVERLFP